MPGRSKRSSRPTNTPPRPSKKANPAKGASQGATSAPLDRPFAADVQKQASALVVEYQIILSSEDGEWYGRGLELPHVFGNGPTPEKCIASTREALAAVVSYLLEQGHSPPTPARHGKRTTQVNVRLTAEEKAILEGAARRKGFEGLSDFLRAAALESAR